MTGGAAAQARFSDYLELTKPRLSFLSVLTALVGYFAARPAFDPVRIACLAAGTSLAAGGVASLNQWLESDTDARMSRTALRPIPTGKIAGGSAFVLGWLIWIAALMLIFALVGKLSSLFALLTISFYLGWYTPAKRWSRWSTEIGAIARASAADWMVGGRGHGLRTGLDPVRGSFLLAGPPLHGDRMDVPARLFRGPFPDAPGPGRSARQSCALVVHGDALPRDREPASGVSRFASAWYGARRAPLGLASCGGRLRSWGPPTGTPGRADCSSSPLPTFRSS